MRSISLIPRAWSGYATFDLMVQCSSRHGCFPFENPAKFLFENGHVSFAVSISARCRAVDPCFFYVGHPMVWASFGGPSIPSPSPLISHSFDTPKTPRAVAKRLARCSGQVVSSQPRRVDCLSPSAWPRGVRQSASRARQATGRQRLPRRMRTSLRSQAIASLLFWTGSGFDRCGGCAL